MGSTDTQFAGSIPRLYDRCLGPLLFQPYAVELGRRIAAFEPGRVLEIAAGTGILTEQLFYDLVNAQLVATDLNPAMLEVAASKIPSDKVEFKQADALDLPFEEESFDVVVCQFGVMFYPDKVKGHREANRVLRTGGHYVTAVWDRIENNPASKVASDAVAALYPGDPPMFLRRTPFGYADPKVIESDLRAAGFEDLEVERVECEGARLSALDAATGLVAGCPLAAEVQQRDPDGLQAAIEAAAEALAPLEGDGTISRLSAFVVTATK